MDTHEVTASHEEQRQLMVIIEIVIANEKCDILGTSGK